MNLKNIIETVSIISALVVLVCAGIVIWSLPDVSLLVLKITLTACLTFVVSTFILR